MKFPCTIKKLIEGDWQALSLGSTVGNVEIIAASRDQALEGLRNEIRYRLEWCPCSTVGDEFVELEIQADAAVPWRGTVF
ncbi:MAG: hypothetical protein QGG40_21805 [Myxococcota bacterium]|nr:hypothetical protein [Myxococcota bacterium]